MSEIELAKITAYIESIRVDITELKDGYREVVRAITKLAVIEDRFKGNDESHRLIWDNINKIKDSDKNVVTRSDLKLFGGIITVIFGIVSFFLNFIFRFMK